MKLLFISVGKSNENYIKEGVTDFTQRINKYFNCNWLIIPTPKNAASMPIPDLKKAEADRILGIVQKDDFLVLLDEKGKQFNSPKLADFLQKKANDSTKQMVFLIGGAFGVHASILDRANFCWSMSDLVFPHMLVRLILAEQIYRACTILKNEKYHHP